MSHRTKRSPVSLLALFSVAMTMSFGSFNTILAIGIQTGENKAFDAEGKVLIEGNDYNFRAGSTTLNHFLRIQAVDSLGNKMPTGLYFRYSPKPFEAVDAPTKSTKKKYVAGRFFPANTDLGLEVGRVWIFENLLSEEYTSFVYGSDTPGKLLKKDGKGKCTERLFKILKGQPFSCNGTYLPNATSPSETEKEEATEILTVQPFWGRSYTITRQTIYHSTQDSQIKAEATYTLDAGPLSASSGLVN